MKGIVIANQEKYLTTLRNKPDALIAEMEEFALENQVPILNWNAAELLEMLVRNSKPKRVLEIGMAIGYSSIRIARQLKKKSILHAIEKSKVNIELAAAYIDRAELTDKIQIMEGDALAIMPEMKKKYDFIFLDADKQDYEKLFHYSLKLLKKNGIIPSMSRKGNCWDNAVGESFVHTLKVEKINRTRYRTREEAKRDIFEYVEMYYNRKRAHSSLGYMSPFEFETRSFTSLLIVH